MTDESILINLVARIEALDAKNDARHEETLRYRQHRRDSDNVIHNRIDKTNQNVSDILETINQGKGAAYLFTKFGAIAASIAAVGAAGWMMIKESLS